MESGEGLCSETGEPVWKRAREELVLGDEAGEVTRALSSVDFEFGNQVPKLYSKNSGELWEGRAEETLKTSSSYGHERTRWRVVTARAEADIEGHPRLKRT